MMDTIESRDTEIFLSDSGSDIDERVMDNLSKIASATLK
jgi:hypothetical protein